MIFEIRDLKFATPATATRAGILYISEGRQWTNMVASWLDRVAKPYAEKAKWKVRCLQACVAASMELFMPAHQHIVPACVHLHITRLIPRMPGPYCAGEVAVRAV